MEVLELIKGAAGTYFEWFGQFGGVLFGPTVGQVVGHIVAVLAIAAVVAFLAEGLQKVKH